MRPFQLEFAQLNDKKSDGHQFVFVFFVFMIRKKHFAIYTKKFLMHKKRGLVLHSRIAGFTLLEIMIAIIGFSLLMVVVFTIFQKFIILKYNAQARGSMIEKSYFALEKINLLLKDYAIDYEEYFNRQNV